jgi:hypothetical protein
MKSIIFQTPQTRQLLLVWSRLIYEAVNSDEATGEFFEAAAEAILTNVDLLRPTDGTGEHICFKW